MFSFIIQNVFLRIITKSKCLYIFSIRQSFGHEAAEKGMGWLTDKFIENSVSPLCHSTPNHCPYYKYSPKQTQNIDIKQTDIRTGKMM